MKGVISSLLNCFSQGSLKESFDWNEKSKIRKLLSKEKYEHIFTELGKLPKTLNQFIKYSNEKLAVKQFKNLAI